MPTIINLGAFVIRLYAGEHGRPHVHVLGPDFGAVLDIETGDLLAGEIPMAHRRKAVAWIGENRGDLLGAWNALNP
ncbi:MAG: DUF4160 domain-containing protein [Alphaproteobacteria bacterium]|nr:DUF4160 domain-containing protein [Alphaproteobacteria bacterium]